MCEFRLSGKITFSRFPLLTEAALGFLRLSNEFSLVFVFIQERPHRRVCINFLPLWVRNVIQRGLTRRECEIHSRRCETDSKRIVCTSHDVCMSDDNAIVIINGVRPRVLRKEGTTLDAKTDGTIYNSPYRMYRVCLHNWKIFLTK